MGKKWCIDCCIYLKFSDENIYKDTSIPHNIDSYHISEGLHALGNKEGIYSNLQT